MPPRFIRSRHDGRCTGATRLRLLPTAVLLAIGVAVGPAMSAAAAPAVTTHTGSVVPSAVIREVGVVPPAGVEGVRHVAAQHATGSGDMRLVGVDVNPPAWLLLLLVPILLGGTVGVGVTLRRLQ